MPKLVMVIAWTITAICVALPGFYLNSENAQQVIKLFATERAVIPWDQNEAAFETCNPPTYYWHCRARPERQNPIKLGE